MNDRKKEIGSIMHEAEKAENVQNELSDEQLDDVAGGKTYGPHGKTIQPAPTATELV